MPSRVRLLAALSIAAMSSVACADAAKVALVHSGDSYSLTVDGQPFFVQGAGGDYSRQVLKDIGGNAFRTWGADNLDDQLDEAHKLGLKVVVGIWLGHERHKFNYSDPAQVQAQFEKAQLAILKYKDHPAVLAWGIGNEMDGYKDDGGNPKIWAAVEQIAAFAKKHDPNHPTMTVVAEILPKRVANINTLCPSIDIVGINSYGGCPSLPQRYRAAGGVKPYIVTEFGPPGTWEIPKNDWKAVVEPTSTEKAVFYRKAYEGGVLAEKNKLCLGSFVFAWGNKQEATATWFGMFLPDGSRTAAVDTMQELWSGKAPANRTPVIEALSVPSQRLKPGQTLSATLNASDPESDALTTEWQLSEEAPVYGVGGDVEEAPSLVKGAVTRSDVKSADVAIPNHPGRYRLFVTVRDTHGGAATANVSLLAEGKEEPGKERLAVAAELPLVLFGEGQKGLPYVWSGWMGKIEAIKQDEKSTDNPQAGKECMKVTFDSADNFGGIVWQAPANDWGDQPGGFDLTGAKKLTFWARGNEGGEKVDFKFGIIGKEKPFPDTASGATSVTLEKDWKQYEIDLAGKDLRRIKTGFVWAVGNPGKPVTFYLDEVKYE
ncbi:MAG: glycoside hydrolase family 2 TIM barrel-domain containing protein [Tepidisphaeraceae bacterium]